MGFPPWPMNTLTLDSHGGSGGLGVLGITEEEAASSKTANTDSISDRFLREIVTVVRGGIVRENASSLKLAARYDILYIASSKPLM